MTPIALTAQIDRRVYLSNHMRDGSVDVRYAPGATRQAVIDAIAADPAVRRVGVEGNHLHVDFRRRPTGSPPVG